MIDKQVTSSIAGSPITSSEASGKPTKITATQTINKGDMHSVAVGSGNIPVRHESDPKPINLIAVPSATITTRKELLAWQLSVLEKAIQVFDQAEKKGNKAAGDNKKILQELFASVEKNQSSQRNEPVSTAELALTAGLEKEISTLLTKSGVHLPTPLSLAVLVEWQIKQVDAALHMLQARDEPDRVENMIPIPGLTEKTSGIKWRRFDSLINQLTTYKNKLVAYSTTNQQASKEHIRFAREMEKELIEQLSLATGESVSYVRKEWHGELTRIQNEQEWNTIETEFEDKGVTYQSCHIPASRLTTADNKPLIPSLKGKGFSSNSTAEARHAVNLWASTFRENGNVIFRGVRHAILSPFGLKGDWAKRQAGARERAKEVVLAALALDNEKLAAALRGEIVNLKIASTSLVTASDLFGTGEGSQIREQVAAWQDVSKYLTFEVDDPANPNGPKKEININLQVATFNFGVNELAVTVGPFGLGWRQSDQYNSEGFAKLIGDMQPGAPIGGWVGEYLKGNPANKVLVETLVEQIRDIWQNKAHHYDGNDPYKMPTRVAVLANAIGIIPAWNCKSGKDRTGMLDAEIKNMLVQLRDQPNNPRLAGASYTQMDQARYRKILAASGNLEIQRYNTGVPGNKVLTGRSRLSIARQRIGDLGFRDLMQGFSFLVKS